MLALDKLICWYLSYLRNCARNWDWLDWVVAPFVVPLITLALVVILVWPRRKRAL